MAYRGEGINPGTVCSRHAAAPAVASCLRCEKAICEICVMYHGAQPHCPACARRAARMQSLGRLAAVAGVIAVAGGGIGYLATRKLPFDYVKAYGRAGTHIAQLAAQVDKEPCQRKQVLELANALINAGDNRAALARTGAFFKACGDWPRLRWASYSAHKHLGEWQLAADEATKLMADNPGDHDFPWWRGQAYEELGQLDQAAADYRKTMELLPAVQGIPFNLSSVLEKQGKFCEAIEPVQHYLKHHPDEYENENIVRRLERLTGPGRCDRRP
jgi:tetratricopeptide (TPR) repeat protein